MTQNWWLALGICTTSFLGSWHCAGMCGPIATLMAQRKSLLAYHSGRMFSYVALGILAGSLGQIFLNSQFVNLRWISAAVFSLLLILMGVQRLNPRWFSSLKFAHGPLLLLKRVQHFHLRQNGFLVGVLTSLLPCGWLYTYVTAAIATQSAYSGALVMFLFWLGGLPSLSVVPAMIRTGLNTASLRQQRIAGLVLIGAGLYSIVSFVAFH